MRRITAPSPPERARDAARHTGATRRSSAAAALALALGPTLVGCNGGGAGETPSPVTPAVTHPAGTVLAIDGLPITAEEVDRWLPFMRLLEPDKVTAHHRRLALANVVLPVKAATALDRAAHEEAYRAAQQLRNLAVELDSMPSEGAVVDYAEGDWSRVGLADWAIASELEVGEWSPVYETVGGFAFLRLIERPAELTGLSQVRFHRAHVFFFEPEGSKTLVDQALRSLPIEVVDPEWEALVPPLYLYPQNEVGRESADR
jgi:hypothetical protein